MGYYMRYLMADARPVDLKMLENALQAIDPDYHIQEDGQIENFGDLFHAGKLYARVEINSPEDDIFEDDLSEFKDLVGEGTDAFEQQVLDVLNKATAIVAVEMFWEETDSEPTLEKIDPLWDWLFENRVGVLQADSEGFYDSTGLIVPRNFNL